MSKINNLQITRDKAKHWNNQSDENNFIVNKQYLEQHVCKFAELSLENTRWVYSHIPKSAGTTCENYLAQLFLIQEILHINAPDLNQLPEIISVKNHCPSFIAGHHPMHGLLYQLLPNEKLAHFTLLREPVARLVSYFNYLKSRESHAMNSVVTNMNFDEFLNQQLVEIHNGQSRRLTGLLHSDSNISDSELFESAKNVVDNCFTLVGVTEQLEEFIQMIEKQCGEYITRSPRKNTSKITISSNDLTHKQIEKIQKTNTADIMLYQYVIDKLSKHELTI